MINKITIKKIKELALDTLNCVLDTNKNGFKEEPEINNVIIFDHMTAYLRNNQVTHLITELFYNWRHLHTSVYFLVKTYKSLEPSIRKLFSNIFLFQISKHEINAIMDEIIEGHKRI